MTSTGLSDVIPVKPHARSLVMIQQIAGMLYVAMVVARTAQQARDAAEAVSLDIDILPAVTSAEAALAPCLAATILLARALYEDFVGAGNGDTDFSGIIRTLK